ncbi:OmpA family protein [Reichenbachiella ulvae]|uniref:OmpA family protein n=1 Tax=Reichenbachiella ulvae TaxID=2980104 RepID=A0ABT3CXW3_9BACT|nr:OmpA family protein [Reichenbachiella ulvae]MCV9388535.1 OmpA family protein [Reichenbachiella ulvae]
MKIASYITVIYLSTLSAAFAQEADTLRRVASDKVSKLNSDMVEYAPSISADGKTMAFESNKSGTYQLYESKLDASGKWMDPVSIDSINNYGGSDVLIAGPSISFDGNTMYFFGSFDGGYGADDIYYSIREESGWSSPVNIGEPINGSGFEGFPSISADGKTLYFVKIKAEGPSDPDLKDEMAGKTCYAIYKSERIGRNNWSIPSLLPAPINEDCEKAPRIMADNRTLIFSSNRLGGKGEYDMYQSYLNDAGDWTEPVALDFVNSPYSDQFPCISAQGDQMYYVYQSSDIYSVDIPEEFQQFKNHVIQGYIRNSNTGEGLYTDITVSDAFTSEKIMEVNNNPNDGRYSLVLAVGRSYNVEFRKDGYTTYSISYDLSRETEYKEVDKDIVLHRSALLHLNIYDIEIFEPISANIIVRETGYGAVVKTMESDESTGIAELELDLGKSYDVTIEKKNFLPQTFTFDVSGLMIYPEFEKDIEFAPKKKEVQINVADLTNNNRVRSRVRIRNRNRDETIEVEGNETVALRVGDRYELEATSDQGYAFNSTIIDMSEEATSGQTKVEVKLALQPLIVGTNLTLKDILFESNSETLTEESFAELARVSGLMETNPNLTVEISAHTDDVGSSAYNKLLSEKRAQSVVSYLIESDIPTDRFVPVGYGEEVPLVPNTSDENRAKNRRVVLKILTI